MTLQEAERPRPQSKRDRKTDDHVLSFRAWCELNGFSPATGRRIINAGNGPVITQLSARRIGITVANNRAWQVRRSLRPG